MDAATTEHVISQVGRVLDAEVIFENRKRQMGLELDKARAETRAYWKLTTPPLNLWQPERTKMSITGLKSGAFQGTIEALRQRLIDKQSQGAAKIAAAGELGASKIDEAVSNAESKIDKEVSDVLQDFSEFTNGGPA